VPGDLLPYRATVEQHGKGPPVVLVHGTPFDLHAWDGVVTGLEPHVRAVTYDLRGHGSAHATPVPSTYATLVDDVVALLDALGIERAHAVGHSFGGQVVLELAVAHPERLSALTVVCARTSPFPGFATVADEVERDGIQPAVDAALGRWFTRGQLARDEPAVRYVRATMTPAVADTLVRAFRLIAPYDLGGRLHGFASPAHFVAAGRDHVGEPADMQRAAGTITGARFDVEPDAGHLLPLEQPLRVAELVLTQ
jgi:3-oxoadipate enol-lactonase